MIAPQIARIFSGKGLIESSLIQPALLGAIGTAAAVTVFIATHLKMPTSTTHALTGALVGAGLMAGGSSSVNWSLLLTKFAQPLLISPIIAIGGSALVYSLFRRLRARFGLEPESCVCIDQQTFVTQPVTTGSALSLTALPMQHAALTLSAGTICDDRSSQRVLGIEARKMVDTSHYLSGGAVCFARAVNDTPKIAALLLAAGAFFDIPPTAGVLAIVALAMSIGGWLQSKRVAQTMSQEITDLNRGQGLTANLVTAGLVLGASRLGLPVSTTHVSCGSIFGIGLATQSGNRRTILHILAAWVTTLPVGFLLGGLFFITFHALS
jgi:PiT family inorganic phosphate transporter